jgi:hypothetical protein
MRNMKVYNYFFLNTLVYLILGSIVLTANLSDVNSASQKNCPVKKVLQAQAHANAMQTEDIKTDLLFKY